MRPLILAGRDGLTLIRTDRADLVVLFSFRFVWGPLPSRDELGNYLAARSATHGPGSHWSDYVGRWRSAHKGRENLGLIEFCQPYDSIELWFDPRPNDQLQLIWLLDCFRSHPETAAKLKLPLIDFNLIDPSPEEIGEWDVPTVDVTEAELETASTAWQAYRAMTPEPCFDLLHTDMSALPQLRPALQDLLAELPDKSTGLGATELRLLELIGRGYDWPNMLFPYHRERLQRRVFNSWETGALLDELGLGPKPAIAGLDQELRTLEYENYRARDEAYKRSRLSLTEFGEAVLAHREDFRRHNPIRRWWGGTELTSDRLWRYTPVLRKP